MGIKFMLLTPFVERSVISHIVKPIMQIQLPDLLGRGKSHRKRGVEGYSAFAGVKSLLSLQVFPYDKNNIGRLYTSYTCRYEIIAIVSGAAPMQYMLVPIS